MTDTDTTQDPCWDFLASYKEQLMQEIAKNLSATSHKRDARNAHNETESNSNDSTLNYSAEELLEVTTQSPVTTESLTEENDVIIPVQGVEMVTETVLSYRPLSGVSSHSHDHHGEFSRTVFRSGETAGNLMAETRGVTSSVVEKVLVFIPRAGLRGLEVSTVWSWVSAGFTILQCIPTPNPGHGLTSLASHCNTAVTEFLTKLEPQPRDVVLLGAGLGANIGLLMDLTPYSQLVLVDLEPSLPGMVWSRPHFLSRAFPSPGPAIPPETVAAAWRVSPLYMVGGVKHNVLLVTTEDPQLVRIYQVGPHLALLD